MTISNSIKRFTLIALSLMVASCASTTAPTELATPPKNAGLVDPRLGWTSPTSQATANRFEVAWREFGSGYFQSARSRFEGIEKRDVSYAPARLGLAAIAIEQGDLATAETIVSEIRSTNSEYLAADVYAAEIALARGELAKAEALSAEISRRDEVPAEVAARAAQIRRLRFDDLLRRAEADATDPRGLIYLREALVLDPASSIARLTLVRRLIALDRYDDARREIDPLLRGTDVDRDDVQELAAESEVGAGRFQEAITRYERLARKTRDERIMQRLSTVKEQWRQTNLPIQYRRAAESGSITRADLAVLLYWNLDSVRFAQVGEPPIAVDISDSIGRDELVRAMAMRLFQVDPIMRRVDPSRTVSASSLARILVRVLLYQRKSCAQGGDSADGNAAFRALESCGVRVEELRASPEGTVSGSLAAVLIERLDKAARSAE